jgi:hypothetical protein
MNGRMHVLIVFGGQDPLKSYAQRMTRSTSENMIRAYHERRSVHCTSTLCSGDWLCLSTKQAWHQIGPIVQSLQRYRGIAAEHPAQVL